MKNRIILFIITTFLVVSPAACSNNSPAPNNPDNPGKPGPRLNEIQKQWAALSGNRQGKVVFSVPPHMYILYLHSGTLKKIPGITTAGAKGRRLRGKSPRPSWSPNGNKFVYRFQGNIYICHENGSPKKITHPDMDCSDETRWTWHIENNTDWITGPSKNKNIIMVNTQNPTEIKTLYNRGDVEKHCDMTGSGQLVYDNGSDIYVTPARSHSRGVKISNGQSCRPCASPGNRAAWLTVPHLKYYIHDASTGKLLQTLDAPPGEELYRLNWSNHPDFAVHMFGSRGDERMNVRKISTAQAIFIGNGWDPDLWVGEKE